MSVFHTQKEKINTYRIKKLSNEPLGEEWLYNWYVRRESDPEDVDFYTIQGVSKENEEDYWSYDPFVVIIFHEETLPNEHFIIYSRVKIINDDVEICESIPLHKVTVSDAAITFSCEDVEIPDCMEAGVEYVASFECTNDEPIDSIEFRISSGYLLDTSNKKFSFINIVPEEIDDTFVATVRFVWNDVPTTTNGYAISARVKKGSVYSPFNSLSNVQVLPRFISREVLGNDKLYQNDDPKPYAIKINLLNRFPSDYYIRLYLQIVEGNNLKNETVDENSYNLVYEDTITNSTNTTSFQYDFELDPSNFNFGISEIGIFHKIVIESEDSSCGKTLESRKIIDFVGCPNTIKIGEVLYNFETCPEIIENDITYEICKNTSSETLVSCVCDETIIESLVICVCNETQTETLTICVCNTTQTEDLIICSEDCIRTHIGTLITCVCNETQTETLTICVCNTTQTEDLIICSEDCIRTHIGILLPCVCDTTITGQFIICVCDETIIGILDPCLCDETIIGEIVVCVDPDTLIITRQGWFRASVATYWGTHDSNETATCLQNNLYI